MNSIVERYDQDAADYSRYWGPVLEQTAGELLEVVEAARPDVIAASPGLRVLDVGAGTGTLALRALERWPAATIVLSDAAAGMLEFARRRITDAAGLAVEADHAEFVNGSADDLPLPDGSVDVAISSFVLQLVPDRAAALREIWRVLRPGGLLAYVTWLDRDASEPFLAAEAFDEAVYDLEIDEPDYPGEPHAGDVRSARSAADELRRAGFVKASAREQMLTYDWTYESYLDYKLAYDERALLSWLDDDQRAALDKNARSRLAELPPDAFRWHAPVVFARAYKP
ncbi:MAG TPA: class I SAM-dependent methyltransferase [Candidatus Limnocylindrales bacterium]|nr:class I SAM-dependent methyltransferase [Candidatus Limnocylindrales bacterium]